MVYIEDATQGYYLGTMYGGVGSVRSTVLSLPLPYDAIENILRILYKMETLLTSVGRGYLVRLRAMRWDDVLGHRPRLDRRQVRFLEAMSRYSARPYMGNIDMSPFGV